jgi:hypothetical protein
MAESLSDLSPLKSPALALAILLLCLLYFRYICGHMYISRPDLCHDIPLVWDIVFCLLCAWTTPLSPLSSSLGSLKFWHLNLHLVSLPSALWHPGFLQHSPYYMICIADLSRLP